MKAKYSIPFFIITSFTTNCNQTTLSENAPLPGSAITIPLSESPDSKEELTLLSNLELLGKLWGFLKYHHPAVGKGVYDWDDELFQMLPLYIEISSTAERDAFLINWIEKYGEIPACTTCKETSTDAFLKPDFSWIERSDMSALLKDKVWEIYQNRHQGEHHYIKISGNPEFLNENPYSQINNLNTGLRLLALYRYWNMIQYFYPSKYLTDNDWNDVLKAYIPKFVVAETALKYQLAVLQLTAEINDTHAFVQEYNRIDSLRGYNHAPFTVRYIENRWVVTDYNQPPPYLTSYNVKKGDIITHINGKSVESIVDSIMDFYPASNEAAKMRNLANDLLRSRNNTIDIEYISSNNTTNKERIFLINQSLLFRSLIYKRNSDSVCYKKIEMDQNEFIGYITLKTIKSEDIAKIKQSFKDSKGIIIDIRNYPNHFVPFLLGAYFVSENRPFAKFSQGNINNPGEFTFRSGSIIRKYEETYKGKLVVIVNEITQSQGEYTAMALRAGDHTTIIGSQTAGADGDISLIIFPGGLGTYISGLGVYYPDGRETQRIGIVPDIEVNPTIKGIREGRDELLERAIEIIMSDSIGNP